MNIRILLPGFLKTVHTASREKTMVGGKTAVQSPGDGYAPGGLPEGPAGDRGKAALREGGEGVLVCGNVSLLSDAALRQAADTCPVVVAGKRAAAPRGRNLRYYGACPGEDGFRRLFDAYGIDTVWYISGYADCRSGMAEELIFLEEVAKLCAANAVSKLIVVSSLESLNFRASLGMSGRTYASGKALATAQMEEFVRFQAESRRLRTVILRAPYIAAGENADTFLTGIFEKLYRGEMLTFPCRPETGVDFLSDADLTELMLSIREEDAVGTEAYNVTSGCRYTWQDVEDVLRGLVPEMQVSYEKQASFLSPGTVSTALRRRYGFLPSDDVLSALPNAYGQYKSRALREAGKKRSAKRLSSLLQNGYAKYAELILLFFLTEYLGQRTSGAAGFSYVDLRLFYVLIMGSTHGALAGVLAGILSGAALVFRFGELGITGTMLFYNVENWLPFVVYLITGSVTGYICNVRRQENSFLQKEMEGILQKYRFLKDIYQGAVRSKEAYKRQILGSRDSFGVVFQAVQRLDSALPQEVFFSAMGILEDILQNRSVAIFTVDDWQVYGRLAACSREMLERLPKSIELDAFTPVCAGVKEGTVWKNREFLEDMPMYAYGISGGKKLELLIFVYDAGPEQMGLYYQNLFQILCGLLKVSFLRASEYQKAIEKEKYYPGTPVLVPSHFTQLYRAQKQMMDAGLSSCCLIRFFDKNRQRVSEALRGRIRSSDSLGGDEKGNLYLLLTQTGPETVTAVENRLRQAGLEYEIVSGI